MTTTTKADRTRDRRVHERVAFYWSAECRRMIAHALNPQMPEWSRDAAEENARAFAARSVRFQRYAGRL